MWDDTAICPFLRSWGSRWSRQSRGCSFQQKQSITIFWEVLAGVIFFPRIKLEIMGYIRIYIYTYYIYIHIYLYNIHNARVMSHYEPLRIIPFDFTKMLPWDQLGFLHWVQALGRFRTPRLSAGKRSRSNRCNGRFFFMFFMGLTYLNILTSGFQILDS